MIGKDAICSCRSLDSLWFPALSIRLDAVILAGHWTEVNNRDNELCVSAAVVDAAKQQSYQFNALEESIGKASEQYNTIQLKKLGNDLELPRRLNLKGSLHTPKGLAKQRCSRSHQREWRSLSSELALRK